MRRAFALASSTSACSTSRRGHTAGGEPRLRELQLRFGKRDLLLGDPHALLVHQRGVKGFDDAILQLLTRAIELELVASSDEA